MRVGPLAQNLRAILAGALLAGCSTNPTHLKMPSRELQLVLPAPFVYEAGGSSGQMRFERTLAAGTYRAIGEDAGGVFFHGPSSCYSVKVLDPGSTLREEMRGRVFSTMDCGIYLPNNAAAAAKIYVVLGTSSQPLMPPVLGQPDAALLYLGGVNTMQRAVDAVHTGSTILEGGNFNFVVSPPGNALRERLARTGRDLH